MLAASRSWVSGQAHNRRLISRTSHPIGRSSIQPRFPAQHHRQQQRPRSSVGVAAAAAPGAQPSAQRTAAAPPHHHQHGPSDGLVAVVAEPVPIAARPPALSGLSVPELSMSTAVAALTAGAAIAWLARFATADADVGLLLRGRHARGAFKGRVVWVTGASQGLGAVLARYLCAQGARLVLSSRSAEKLQRVKESCTGEHASEILVLPFDLGGPAADLAAAARAADGAFGGAGVDYLIHNAGACVLAWLCVCRCLAC
jgi:hypothetical protein